MDAKKDTIFEDLTRAIDEINNSLMVSNSNNLVRIGTTVILREKAVEMKELFEKFLESKSGEVDSKLFEAIPLKLIYGDRFWRKIQVQLGKRYFSE